MNHFLSFRLQQPTSSPIMFLSDLCPLRGLADLVSVTQGLSLNQALFFFVCFTWLVIRKPLTKTCGSAICFWLDPDNWPLLIIPLSCASPRYLRLSPNLHLWDSPSSWPLCTSVWSPSIFFVYFCQAVCGSLTSTQWSVIIFRATFCLYRTSLFLWDCLIDRVFRQTWSAATCCVRLIVVKSWDCILHSRCVYICYHGFTCLLVHAGCGCFVSRTKQVSVSNELLSTGRQFGKADV